ncbi:TerD family protein [Streptomyces sp. NPDC097619]|uniref:TerD family protein n=1 Tax=Streptomyces sp. NPDC097619 TaxID=3157228 RepID=UPI003324B597
MTAELVRGQNHPLTGTRVEIRVSAGTPVLAGAALADERGQVAGARSLAHPGAPELPGVRVTPALGAEHRLTVDLAALPGAVHRVAVLLALPAGGPTRFGAVPAPSLAVAAPDGTVLVDFTVTDLDSESAVVALELYRRQDAWKVRAVGQGYADGLAALLADHGLAGPAAVALAAEVQAAAGPVPTAPGPYATVPRTVAAPEPAPAAGPGAPAAPGPAAPSETPGGPARTGSAATGGADRTVSYAHPRRGGTTPPAPAPAAATAADRPAGPLAPVAGDATGWSMEERLYNQVWGMFEDLARAVAAYRGAVDFADGRLDRELDDVLSDPRSRLGGTGDAAREAAQARRDELVARAVAVLDRDLDQLAAEAEVVEPALPPAFARWDLPAWQAHRLPTDPPLALRLGELHLPERPGLRIPMLARLPLERGLWIDCGRTGSEAAMAMDTAPLRRAALDTAVALAVRILAVHPAGRFAVDVIDPAGAGAAALAPLVRAGLAGDPADGGAPGVHRVLERLTRRVDLAQMAVRGGDLADLPPDVDRADRLLIVHDFPHGFDDRAVTRLRYLADEGPAVGVHLLMVADRDEASAFGPLLDPLWKSLLRLSPVPDDHLADPWVGHAWTFEAGLPPAGSAVLDHVLAQVTAARGR